MVPKQTGVAAAAVSTKTFYSSSGRQLRVILLALKHVYCSKEKTFITLSDSLWSLKAISNLKFGHPILVEIIHLYMNLTKDGKDIVFVWVPRHVSIGGNSSADSVAKDVLVGDVLAELIPFSDLKSRANKYILQLWQYEWDQFPENKLHKIFSFINDCIICPRTNRKEKTVITRLHIGHSFITHYIPFYWRVRNRGCASDVMNF